MNWFFVATTITYDQHGGLASLTNGEGNEVDYSNFDVLGNPRQMKNARGGIGRVTYTAKGWKFTDVNAFIA